MCKIFTKVPVGYISYAHKRQVKVIISVLTDNTAAKYTKHLYRSEFKITVCTYLIPFDGKHHQFHNSSNCVQEKTIKGFCKLCDIPSCGYGIKEITRQDVDGYTNKSSQITKKGCGLHWDTCGLYPSFSLSYFISVVTYAKSVLK